MSMPDLPTETNVSLTNAVRPKRKRCYSSVSENLLDCVSKITKLAENRANYEKEMAERRLAIDQKNADALTRMAEAMYVLATSRRN